MTSLKAKQSNDSQMSKKRKRIESSEESSGPLPPRLSNRQASSKKRRVFSSESLAPPAALPPPGDPYDLPGPQQSPPSEARGATPEPTVATQAASSGDDDFFASYRNLIKQEHHSPGRPDAPVRLYTGQIYDSRDAFVNAVLQHTEERNPGCRLSVANTDPARVRVYCMLADCPYSFNSVYEHGARRVPAVKVTAVGSQSMSIASIVADNEFRRIIASTVLHV